MTGPRRRRRRLPCENMEFFLNLCLVLKQYITLEQYSTSLLFLLLSYIYYFRKYDGKHLHCLYTGGRPLRNNHGRGQPQENVLLGRMGERSANKDNVLWKVWPFGQCVPF